MCSHIFPLMVECINKRLKTEGNHTKLWKYILPQELNAITSVAFYKETMDKIKFLEPEEVAFRFRNLQFIEPAGMVTLTNMIELISHDYPDIDLRYSYPTGYNKDSL